MIVTFKIYSNNSDEICLKAMILKVNRKKGKKLSIYLSLHLYNLQKHIDCVFRDILTNRKKGKEIWVEEAQNDMLINQTCYILRLLCHKPQNRRRGI